MKDHRREFGRIMENYEVLMLKSCIAAAIVQFTMEVAFYFILLSADEMNVGPLGYFLIYVALPLFINTLGIVVAIIVMQFKRKRGIYITKAPLFAMEVISFTCVLFHMEFPALTVAFIIPPICSIYYTSKKISKMIAALSVVLEIAAYFLSALLLPSCFPKYRGFGMEQMLNQVLYVVAIVCIYFLVIKVMEGENKKKELYIQLEKEEKEVRIESVTDALTGLYNRRKLKETFDELFDEENVGGEWAFVLADLDDFKKINDTYGHSIGDEYLKTFGQILSSVVGKKAFRYGGDEFCFIALSAHKAEVFCEQVRSEYAKAEVCREYVPNHASFGIAVWDGRETPSDWVARADEALYEAKKQKGMTDNKKHTWSDES